MMSVDVVVIGAGGFGRELLDVIEAHNRAENDDQFNVIGVLDDAPSEENLDRLRRRGYKHLGGIETYFEMPSTVNYFVGVGAPEVKARIVEACDARDRKASKVVHPSASVGSATTLSAGTVVCGGVQVSTNVRLGRHVHLNPGCIIGHDSILGDFISVNPGAIVSGEVEVDSKTLIGAGALVLQGIIVGEGSIVGASACVTREVEPHSTVVGVPAKEIRHSVIDTTATSSQEN